MSRKSYGKYKSVRKNSQSNLVLIKAMYTLENFFQNKKSTYSLLSKVNTRM